MDNEPDRPTFLASEVQSKNLREQFQKHGFVIVEGLFSKDEISALRQIVFALYCEFNPGKNGMQAIGEPWHHSIFDKKLIEFRKRDARLFGVFYDCIQNSPLLTRLVTEPKAQALAAAVLGASTESLSFSGIVLRMDTPFDNRNTFQWHQDHAYYPQNREGGRGAVLTVALHDISAEMGALIISPGSHKEGLAKADLSVKKEWNRSLQRSLPPELVDRYPEICPELKMGDVLVIHMDLFHRSGDNSSSLVRQSALCRYHLMMADDYVPHRIRLEFDSSKIDDVYTDTDAQIAGRNNL